MKSWWFTMWKMSFFQGEQVIKKREGEKESQTEERQRSERREEEKVKDEHDWERTDRMTRKWRRVREDEWGHQTKEEEKTRVNGDKCREELKEEFK